MSLRASKNSNEASDQPPWLQNPKRRTIPNHLVPQKRPGFQLSTGNSVRDATKLDKKNSELKDFSSYNLLSFGSTQRKGQSSSGTADSNTSIMSQYDTSSGDLSKIDTTTDVLVEEFPFNTNDEDSPPSRSIYDLNDEVLISLNKTVNSNSESYVQREPRNFSNAFNRVDAVNNKETKPESSLEQNPLENGSSAILVFGYPENMSNQVIAHFLEFGTVLEDFEVAKQNKSMVKYYQSAFSEEPTKIVPIFSGNSWIKITYDNPSSAFDALQENGNVFNGHLLGVTPYSRTAVEKLQKKLMKSEDDIGGGIRFKADLFNISNKADVGASNELQSTYISKLNLKDGTGLFLNSNAESMNAESAKKEEDMSLFKKACRYFFGFYEL